MVKAQRLGVYIARLTVTFGYSRYRIVAKPSDDIFQRATTALRVGKFAEAERDFRKLLKAQPRHVGALNLLGIILVQRGKFAEAEPFVKRALHESPNSDATLYNYGIVLKALGRPEEAVQRFSQALAINPAADGWNNRGTACNDLGRYREAIIDFDKAIALNPKYAAAYCNKAKSLAALKSYDQALDAFDRALALEPNFAWAWSGRGNLLFDANRCDEASEAYDHALRLQPDLAEAWLGRGNVFAKVHRHADAAAAYDRALALKPELADAWLGHGNNFADVNRFDQAAAAFDKAIALRPDLAKAWAGRGAIFSIRKQFGDALAAYDKALAIDSDLTRAVCGRVQAKQYMCDWTNFHLEVSHLQALIEAQTLISNPFVTLSLPISAAEQYECVRRYAVDQPRFPPRWRGERYTHDRIRVAYVSSDLRDHPVGRQIVELFEQHDKSRFELTAISLGAAPGSETRSRIKAAFEHFVDAPAPDDREIADYIHRHEIDIAVDLNGLTDGNRQNVFAQRPAPVQVNYLGYAGTLGADYYDYILGDRTIIPEDQFQFYSEKAAWLPDSYMATESLRPISGRAPVRADQNLPETGFVFCCFNASFKLSSEVFSVWMRLLKAIAGSVLWLSDPGEAAKANLQREAEQAGVAVDRLIFATRVPSLADHLARQRLADLFLDTLPYNAHATAVDTLWAGLPVLTCRGETFAGRVATSLLNAVGLPELITGSLADYEALALKLAQDPATLASLKAKLARQRESFPLFDSRRFARNIEAAYVTMWERYRSGQPPAHFAVDAGA